MSAALWLALFTLVLFVVSIYLEANDNE